MMPVSCWSDAAMMPRVKVCCIASVAEAMLAIRHGASALGLVSAMPSGPGVIDDDEIREIARAVPPGIATFLLTAQTNPDAIAGQQRRAGVNTLQLVDRMEAATLSALREELPGIGLVQVVHVLGEESLAEAGQVAPLVDAILLDSGNPGLNVKELGGTGRTHDWEVSRAIVESVPVPVYLAGGLNPGNVREAIRAVRPFGLDLCSGLRTEGALDEARLARFMTEVRAAG
jgi:phosphoribosylanthranilate isomerase